MLRWLLESARLSLPLDVVVGHRPHWCPPPGPSPALRSPSSCLHPPLCHCHCCPPLAGRGTGQTSVGCYLPIAIRQCASSSPSGSLGSSKLSLSLSLSVSLSVCLSVCLSICTRNAQMVGAIFICQAHQSYPGTTTAIGARHMKHTQRSMTTVTTKIQLYACLFLCKIFGRQSQLTHSPQPGKASDGVQHRRSWQRHCGFSIKESSCEAPADMSPHNSRSRPWQDASSSLLSMSAS